MKALVGPTGTMDELRDLIIQRMRSDLYFTVTHVFGLSFFDAPFHQALSQFMWNEAAHPQTIVLAPRGSGKSTIGLAKMTAKFLLNPNKRQLLVCYDLRQATKFLASIRENFILKGKWVRFLFPHIHKIVAETEVRKDYHMYPQLMSDGKPDPHFLAASLNSGITGMHVDIEVDDLIDEVNARSEAECKRACDWVDTSFNVLEHQVKGNFHIRGTHFHLRDPYAYIIERYPNFKVWKHPGLIEIHRDNGETELISYWPSKFSVDDLLTMRSRNQYVFASQIQQQPIQHGDSPFREEWLKYWQWENEGKSILLDTGEIVNLSDLTIAIIYDPAIASDQSRSDTAIVCIGMDSMHRYFVLDVWASKCSPSEGIRTAISMAAKWEPDLIAVEDVLFSSLVIPLLESTAKEHYASYKIMPVAPEGRSKAVRIAALQALFEEGRIFVSKRHDQLITQYLQFPYGQKWDVLDALAYAPKVLYPPIGSLEPTDLPIARGAAIVTGY